MAVHLDLVVIDDGPASRGAATSPFTVTRPAAISSSQTRRLP